MNLGQFITANSPLTSATVAEHLAAIAANTGSGQTIFVSQLSAVFDQPTLIVTRKPKRQPLPAEGSRQRTTPGNQVGAKRSFSALLTQPTLTVQYQSDEITVTRRSTAIVVTNRLNEKQILANRKSR